MTAPTLIVTTAAQPGAVAILQLHGPGTRNVVQRVTRRDRFDDDRLYVTPFADIDEGLTVCRGDDWAQLMPHGGPRVVEKLVELLQRHGAVSRDVDALVLYPEADSAIEADMLAALATSPSPAAIDLLLAQPQLWRDALRSPASALRDLDYLLHPPTVVVAGAPNVGKSTLANVILGRRVSLVSDLPGATRDWVGSLAEISGVALHWIDTPGIRSSDDPIEREAIRLASAVIERADVLIAMRDGGSEYPVLPRGPDVRVVNKVDDPGKSPGRTDELAISALHRRNLDALQRRVLEVLQLSDLAPDTRWAFSPTLKRYVDGEAVDLAAYVGSMHA